MASPNRGGVGGSLCARQVLSESRPLLGRCLVGSARVPGLAMDSIMPRRRSITSAAGVMGANPVASRAKLMGCIANWDPVWVPPRSEWAGSQKRLRLGVVLPLGVQHQGLPVRLGHLAPPGRLDAGSIVLSQDPSPLFSLFFTTPSRKRTLLANLAIKAGFANLAIFQGDFLGLSYGPALDFLLGVSVGSLATPHSFNTLVRSLMSLEENCLGGFQLGAGRFFFCMGSFQTTFCLAELLLASGDFRLCFLNFRGGCLAWPLGSWGS